MAEEEEGRKKEGRGQEDTPTYPTRGLKGRLL